MTFSINFTEDFPEGLTDEDKSFSSYGEIIIGEFREGVQFITTDWNERKYKQQWIHGLERLLHTDSQNSCLITSMYQKDYNELIELWTLHKVEYIIIIIQQMYLPVVKVDDVFRCSSEDILTDPNAKLDKIFDPENPYSHIIDRTIAEEDGPVSEWETTPEELEEFLNFLKLDIND